MMNMIKKSNNLGFTLPEMILVIAILGILATLASVSFIGMTEETTVKTATEQVKQHLKLARTEAVARNTFVDFAKISGSNICSIRLNDNSFNAIETLSKSNLIIGSQNNAVTLVFNNLNPGERVVFNPKGEVGNAASGTPSITIIKGSHRQTVTIESQTGYIH